MNEDFSKRLNELSNILSILNFMLNQESLSNQDLAKMLDEKTHEMLQELEDKLDIIIKQNEEIILLLKNERRE